MDFYTFVRIIRSRWKVVLAAIAACLVGAVAITMVQAKSYQASATILVSFAGVVTINDVYEATQASQQRLSSYAEIAGGRTVAQRAIDRLGIPLTVDELVESTDVTYTPESTVFQLTVADSDPQQAAALAAAMADEFAVLVPGLDTGNPVADAIGSGQGMSGDGQQPLPVATATVVEPPTVPQRAVSPVPVRNVALGLVAGVLLSVALALVRDATDRTVRNRETLAARSGLPTLAQLPRSRGKEVAARHRGGRSKPSDVVSDESVRALRTRLIGSTTVQARSVLVTAPTIGQGVSTTALHLALSFAEVDETVLLIEGDFRRPTIAGLLGAESELGLAEVLADQQILDDAVLPTAHPGLWVLASTKPAVFTKKFSTPVVATMLEKLRGGFDRVVIDGPPALVTMDAGLFGAAVDATVLVVRAGRTTVDEVDGALENLRAADGNVVGNVLTAAPVSRAAKAATAAYRAKVGRATSGARRPNGS